MFLLLGFAGGFVFGLGLLIPLEPYCFGMLISVCNRLYLALQRCARYTMQGPTVGAFQGESFF
tara:strand:- start:1585 stop:1773 length:189 start_codon:yes stop_codon:yes gene_type:complete